MRKNELKELVTKRTKAIQRQYQRASKKQGVKMVPEGLSTPKKISEMSYNELRSYKKQLDVTHEKGVTPVYRKTTGRVEQVDTKTYQKISRAYSKAMKQVREREKLFESVKPKIDVSAERGYMPLKAADVPSRIDKQSGIADLSFSEVISSGDLSKRVKQMQAFAARAANLFEKSDRQLQENVLNMLNKNPLLKEYAPELGELTPRQLSWAVSERSLLKYMEEIDFTETDANAVQEMTVDKSDPNMQTSIEIIQDIIATAKTLDI